MANQNQNVPAPPAKKSHTARNIIIIIIILLCILLFMSMARFFISPMIIGAAMDALIGGKMEDITKNLNSTGSNLVPEADIVASENYLIKQKSSIPISISAPKGVFDAKATIDFITVGFPMSKSPSGSYGWQGDWKVIVNSYSKGNTSAQFKGPGFHTSSETTDINGGSSQYVYYFTLKGVKEGDEFEARVVTKPITDASYHFNESTWKFYDEHNALFRALPFDTSEQASEYQTQPGDQTVKAILVKSNGKDGAIIGFPPVELTKEQQAQLDAMNQAMQGKKEFTQWWNSQLYPMYTHLPQMPPFKIVLQSNLPAEGYFQDEINNADYWNTGANK